MPPKSWNHAGSFPRPSNTFPPYSVKAIVKPELKILSSSSKESLGISLDSLDIDSTTKQVPNGISPFSAFSIILFNAPAVLFLPLPDIPKSLNSSKLS